MSILLTGDGGIRIDLDADAYQFGHANDYWDRNWLQIRGEIRHPRGAWRFRDPCLTAPEVEQLARWLDHVGATSEEVKPCFFTEPNLAFSRAATPAGGIQVMFAHECAPPWLRTVEERIEGFPVFCPLSLNQPSILAASVRDILRRFPVRQ